MKNGNRLLLFNDLSSAITSLQKSLELDLTNYNELENDIIKNGQIQKFEYTIELFGKRLRNILK